jgi:hypothetical protein
MSRLAVMTCLALLLIPLLSCSQLVGAANQLVSLVPGAAALPTAAAGIVLQSVAGEKLPAWAIPIPTRWEVRLIPIPTEWKAATLLLLDQKNK